MTNEKSFALIVDDEPDLRELLEITLGRMNIETYSAGSVKDAKKLINAHEFNLCLTDMKLPDGDGLEILEYIKSPTNNIPVAIITAHGNMEIAIKALKMGAFDFINKPIDNVILKNLVTKALSHSQSFKDAPSEIKLIGQSKPLKDLRKKISKLSHSLAPILITGPSGSGKELVAREIHNSGPNSKNNFVAVNCGAIPSQLMESELFGFKKGSFTGANADKKGLFEIANHGTLFLDEIGELPFEMQVKLLRAIQEKSIRPVGSPKEISVDVRILTATHQDLTQLVNEYKFREDLYFRINVIELKVPSLCERVEDIPELANYILQKLCKDENLVQPALTKEATEELLVHDFPGNVRELENILARAITLCDNNIIKKNDLQINPQTQINFSSELDVSPFLWNKDSLEEYVENIETALINQALTKCKYNKVATAKLLGITLSTLRYRLKKLNILDRKN